MMPLFITLLSFVLDGLLSIYRDITFFYIISFKSMFAVTSLVIVYPIFHKNYLSYYKLCAIIGLLYDLLYTNTLIFNMIVFVLLGILIHKLYFFADESFIGNVVLNLIVITAFYIINFVVLSLIGYIPFKLIDLSYGFLGVVLTNTVYFALLYFVVKFITIKRIKKSKYSL